MPFKIGYTVRDKWKSSGFFYRTNSTSLKASPIAGSTAASLLTNDISKNLKGTAQVTR